MSVPPRRPSTLSKMSGTVTLRLRNAQSNFHRQTIPVRLWVWVMSIGLYAGFATVKEYSFLKDIRDLPAEGYALFGVVLSVLMVFRTNTAYDRWWEARKQWGQLLNDSRSLVIKVRHLVVSEAEDRIGFARLVIAFGYSLKDHLRGSADLREVAGFEKASASPKNVPAYFIGLMYQRISDWREENKIDGFTALMLDRHTASFSDILGACERIRNTPISISYRRYVKLCLLLYIAALPWGLEHQLQFWTVPITMVVSFFMLGLEMIARAVEEPFGIEADDLPLDALCETNERNVQELLSQPTELPRVPTPRLAVVTRVDRQSGDNDH